MSESSNPAGQVPEDAHSDAAFQEMLARAFDETKTAGELGGPAPSFAPVTYQDESEKLYIGREFTLEEFERWFDVQRLGSLPFNAIGYHHTWSPTPEIWAGIRSLEGVFSYYSDTLGWRPIGCGPHIFVYSGDGSYSPGTPRIYVATHPASDGYGMVTRNGRWLHIEHIWNGDSQPFSDAMKQVSGQLLGILCRAHPNAPRTIPLTFIRDGGVNNPTTPIGIMYHRDEIPRPKSCPGDLVTHENLDPDLVRYAATTYGGGGATVISAGGTTAPSASGGERAWRKIGQVDFSVWSAELGALNSPILAEGDAPYKAAGEHSALCLAQILHESVGGTQGIATTGGHNALGQRPRPGDTIAAANNYARFDTWADCVRYWFGKLADPTYAYAPTTTLAEFIHVYSPDSDNAPGQEIDYRTRIESWLTKWGIAPKTDGPGASTATAAPAAYVAKHPIEGPIEPKKINGRIYLPLKQSQWTAVQQTPRREWASPTSGEVGPPVKVGDQVTFHYGVVGDDGQMWLIHQEGTRALASAFVAG